MYVLIIMRAGKRCGNTIQVWHILLHAGAREASIGVERKTGEDIEQEDCEWDPASQEVLQGWGVSPAVPCKGWPIWFQAIHWERMQWSYSMLRLTFHASPIWDNMDCLYRFVLVLVLIQTVLNINIGFTWAVLKTADVCNYFFIIFFFKLYYQLIRFCQVFAALVCS